MDEICRRQIIESHRESLETFGHSPHALFWSSYEAQKIRFDILSRIGVRSGDSVLDVGCGFADLRDWLDRQGKSVRYTGLDLSPDMLATARQLHADLPLVCGEIFALAPQSAFDWVLLSGALNWPMPNGEAYVRRVIRHMLALCRKGVAFNLLDGRHTSGVGRFGLQAFDPADVMAWCAELGAECRLVDGYLNNDFTLYLTRR